MFGVKVEIVPGVIDNRLSKLWAVDSVRSCYNDSTRVRFERTQNPWYRCFNQISINIYIIDKYRLTWNTYSSVANKSFVRLSLRIRSRTFRCPHEEEQTKVVGDYVIFHFSKGYILLIHRWTNIITSLGVIALRIANSIAQMSFHPPLSVIPF